ncbi:MAG: hypothetical protein ACRDBG_12675, partial [Waterburya sp.]
MSSLVLAVKFCISRIIDIEFYWLHLIKRVLQMVKKSIRSNPLLLGFLFLILLTTEALAGSGSL